MKLKRASRPALNVCETCGIEIIGRAVQARFCLECAKKRREEQQQKIHKHKGKKNEG